jgi:hypothetical protein
MITLSPVDQQLVVAASPDVFAPVKGAWGRRGATSVKLKEATKAVVRDAMAAAWRKKAPKKLASQI